MGSVGTKNGFNRVDNILNTAVFLQSLQAAIEHNSLGPRSQKDFQQTFRLISPSHAKTFILRHHSNQSGVSFQLNVILILLYSVHSSQLVGTKCIIKNCLFVCEVFLSLVTCAGEVFWSMLTCAGEVFRSMLGGGANSVQRVN